MPDLKSGPFTNIVENSGGFGDAVPHRTLIFNADTTVGVKTIFVEALGARPHSSTGPA